MFSDDLQNTVYYNSYSRWLPDLKRRETWEETQSRVCRFFALTAEKYKLYLGLDFWSPLTKVLGPRDVLPSMRILQMAGPTLERCNVGAYNCAYLPLQDWQDFAELLYILMQGTGVGFSVEQKYVDSFQPIDPQLTNRPEAIHIVEDSTIGWCEALRVGLEMWATGYDVEFDYSKIRPQGSPLLTKGGQASGPEPLKNLLDFARKLLLAHQGRKLSSLNLHDLACYCGSIVQVGGVRRAAEISLSDLSDTKMRHAKTGQFWNKAPERAMANNSAVYTQMPDTLTFIDEWKQLIESGTGERGIFNRQDIKKQIPIRRNQNYNFGVNPCGEIILRPYEFCNLSIAVARAEDTLETMEHKVRMATRFGMLQALLTDFQYLRTGWKYNCDDERLLGVDITGQMDCGLFTGPGTKENYAHLLSAVKDEVAIWASQFKINFPAALTCVKPSGNSSQFLGCSSGIHPRYAEYYIRRVRIGAQSALAKFLISNGLSHHPEVGQPSSNPSVWVFDFPQKSPQGAKLRKDMSAIDQLEQMLACHENWAEHLVSCTVYVRDNEWLEVGAWVQKHWHQIGGVSFLPYSGGVYDLAPYEEITEHEYNLKMASFPKLDWTELKRFELSDTTNVSREYACTGDKCEL